MQTFSVSVVSWFKTKQGKGSRASDREHGESEMPTTQSVENESKDNSENNLKKNYFTTKVYVYLEMNKKLNL